MIHEKHIKFKISNISISTIVVVVGGGALFLFITSFDFISELDVHIDVRLLKNIIIAKR